MTGVCDTLPEDCHNQEDLTPVWITATCPDCKKGKIESMGNVLPAHIWHNEDGKDHYPHQCTNCLKQMTFDVAYPSLALANSEGETVLHIKKDSYLVKDR